MRKKKPLCVAAALHCAVAWHQSEAVTTLIRAGADVHVRSVPGNVTALHLASSIARPDIVRALLDGGAELEAQDSFQRTPLDYGVAWGHEFPGTVEGGSYFHEVAPPKPRNDEESRAAVVTLLLDRGACPGKDESKRSTVLRAATLEACLVLLEREAASTGPVPTCYLVLAAERGHEDLVVRFLDRDLSPDAIQRAYFAVLRELGHSRGKSNDRLIVIAHMLERKGADASEELPEAIERGAVEAVKILLKAGADSNRPGKDGSFPAHIAAKNGSVELLELLLDCGASVHACDPAGQTPLHSAILGRHDHCARMLLKRGANPRHRRKSQFGEETSIELARDQGLHDLALMMEKTS